MKEQNFENAIQTRALLLALYHAREQVVKGQWSFVQIRQLSKPLASALLGASESRMRQNAKTALLTYLDQQIDEARKALTGLGLELSALIEAPAARRAPRMIEEPVFEEPAPKARKVA